MIKMMIKKMRHQSNYDQDDQDDDHDDEDDEDDEDDDEDDDQENEASVIRQAGAPLAHLEGNHRTKTCSLHAIFFKQLPLLFCIFK